MNCQKSFSLLSLILVLLAVGPQAAAGSPAVPKEDTTPSRPSTVSEDKHPSLAPWSGLGQNALAVFSGSNALLHLSALGGTVLIIGSGLDTQVHNFFVRNTFFENPSHLAVSSVAGRRIPGLGLDWRILPIDLGRRRHTSGVAPGLQLYDHPQSFDRPPRSGAWHLE